MMSPVANESKGFKLLELEGLRGVAALFVVFSHLQAAFFGLDFAAYLKGVEKLPYPLDHLVHYLSIAPLNGRFCVWIFWTLSGFALSYRFFLLRSSSSVAKSRWYLFEAGLRRYPRLLLPVLAATLFSYVLCATGMMQSARLAEVMSPPGHLDPWLAETYNFVPSFPDAMVSSFWTTFFSFHLSPKYDPPLWTMKRELIGSFFVFLFLAGCGGLRLRWVLYLVVGLLSVRFHQIWVDAFLAGIILCDLRVNHLEGWRRSAESAIDRLHELRNSRWLALVGTVGILVILGFFSRKAVMGVDSDPGADLSFIFLSFLTIGWVQFSWVIKKILSSPFFAFLGKISFGIYICHYPFLFSFSAAFYLAVAPTLGHLPSSILTVILTVPCVVGLGTAFYYGSDKPSIPFSKAVAGTLTAPLRVFFPTK